jgi:hypothetical protein
MRVKYLIFTILFIVIGSGSLIFSLISCQSVNDEKTQAVKNTTDSKNTTDGKNTTGSKTSNNNKKKTTAAVVSIPKEKVAALLTSEVGYEKAVQESLNRKSHQILDVWEVVKTMNGVINVLQSAQVKSKYFSETSVINPVEFLAPVHNVLNKISGMFLVAYFVIIFQKMLLALPIFLVIILIIPICALITIIMLWTYKDRVKLYKILIASVLSALLIPFAIQLSINTSSLLGNKVMAKNINALVTTITEENGKAASAMEDDIVRSRKTGHSIIKYMDRVKTLSETIIENVMDYIIIFLFIFVVIPILILLLILFLAIYGVRLILGKQVIID